MRSIGVRNLDKLGRLTLPKELREKLAFGEHQKFLVWNENGCICLQPISGDESTSDPQQKSRY